MDGAGHVLAEVLQCFAADGFGNIILIQRFIFSMPDFYNLADIVDEAFKREALYHRGDVRKEEPSMNAGSIKNVIFNPPATVVYWTDGTKTVVKCNENDIFDPEKGLALAVAKRCAGNRGAYYTEIRHWVKKCWKDTHNKPCTAEHSANLDAVKASIEKMNHNFDDLLDGAVAGNPARFMKKLCEMKANLAATIHEKLADVVNAIAECCEKVTTCFMDLIEEIKGQPLKMILQKLRPDYKDKCKIRWLDIPNKVMQGRIRRFC